MTISSPSKGKDSKSAALKVSRTEAFPFDAQAAMTAS
jgi:hypothetical protein